MSRLIYFILIILTSTVTFCQGNVEYERYYSESNGGLCSQTLLLFANKTYKSERGCEASSHISFGTWKQFKDTVIFYPINNKKFKLIEKVVSSKTNSKFLRVRVYDSVGNNITDKVSAGQYVKGKGTYVMKLDSIRSERSDFIRDNGVIVINSFQKIFEQNFEILPDSLNSFDITINIPDNWIFNKVADWGEHETFRLLKRKDKLLSMFPNQFDGNGNMVRQVFSKQKE